MKRSVTLIIFFFCLALTIWGSDSPYIHHILNVTPDPGNSNIRVVDTVTVPGNLIDIKDNKLHFMLHGNLDIISISDGLEAKKEPGEMKSEFSGNDNGENETKNKIPLDHYSIAFTPDGDWSGKTVTFTIEYSGKINHPVEQEGAEYARGFSETPGIISNDGIYLSGASYWVPWFGDNLVTFELQCSTGDTWDIVSQGNRTVHESNGGIRKVTWNSPEPMDEIYLIGGPFVEYGLTVDKVNVMAFLRSKDDPLADKYLETTGQYLEMYRELIGPYPYSKFALIENFWETGYGMPSFTLLGPKVIRFPFILHSSYPHELLHNWWGNSVLVDYKSGNWCEGLTTYLADHLIKEQRGEGEEYRKTTLQDYTHYAADKKEEFPLSQFTARSDALSSSIGYGKSLMVYHMLRQMVGDEDFKKIIRHFYKENKFKHASFDDFRKSAEAVTGKDLTGFFNQWITRAGTPEIQLSNWLVIKREKDYLLRFTLHQLQKADPFIVRIVAAITLENKKEGVIKVVEMVRRHQNFEFAFTEKPVMLDIDPQFDVFRKLHNNEIPATLSSIFGAKSVLILLPSKAPKEFLDGYKTLAQSWAKDSEGQIEIKNDRDFAVLPSDRAIWLFGNENLHTKKFMDLERPFLNKIMDSQAQPLPASDAFMILDGKPLVTTQHSIIASVKNDKNPSNVIVLLTAHSTAAMPGLGRKLPHYGKYSYLAFEGDEPANIVKGQWPLLGSPMSADLKTDSLSTASVTGIRGTLPTRNALANLAPLFSSQRMMGHIRYLASDDLEGRGLGTPGLQKAADYIAKSFKEAGLKPGGDDGTYFQSWEMVGGPSKTSMKLQNVIGIIEGTNHEWDNQSVIICAHYDHLGRGWPDVREGNEGKVHYGADDNASGVSVMLELAQVLGKSLKPSRSVIFIAFTGEESGILGSQRYVHDLEKVSMDKFKGIRGVINLDSVGRLKPQGKLMVIGEYSAKEWRFIFMGVGYTTGIQTELGRQPLESGDQVSFIKAGIPAIQLFSGPHEDYHRPTDTADKIEESGLTKVATVAREVLIYLAERPEPLTVTEQSETPQTGTPTEARRAGTGFMPDFAFDGKGVRIGMVSPGSAAEKAGLKKDDIITQIEGVEISNLKEYSDLLKKYKPGDTVTVIYTRDGKTNTAKVTLTPR